LCAPCILSFVLTFINSANHIGTLRMMSRTPKQRNYGRPWQVSSYQRNQMSVGTTLPVLMVPKNPCKRPSFFQSNFPISSLENGRHGEVSFYMAHREQGNPI
jgi:hypothetical protein